MKTVLCAVAALVLVIATPRLASASSISITNASFEFPGTGFYTPGVITGWTLSNPSNQGVFQPGAFPGTYYTGAGSTNGVQTAYNNGGTISQTLTDVLLSNTLYTLMVDIGDRKDTTLAGYWVALYAGTNLLAMENSLSPNDGFLTSQLNYLALAGNPFLGQSLRIELGCRGVQCNFDNVSLGATPVPEPAGLLLLGTGLLGVATIIRRRRRQVA